MGEIQLYYDEETGLWSEKKEPFAVVEFATEEEFNLFKEMIDFWHENHKESEDE